MRKFAELNKIGVYRKLRQDNLTKAYTGAYPYINNGVMLRSSPDTPIYSYGKNYKKSGQEFSLFVWTNEKDESKIYDHFEKVVKNLKRAEIMEVINKISVFNYVAPEYGAK